MSIFFKARGTPSVGIFLIRIALGTYFLVLGIQQANNIQAYIDRVKALGVLSENMAFIAGFVLPFILIVFGTLYIMGFFTPVTSVVLFIVLLAKIIVRGIFPSPGIPFNKDIIPLMCTLLTLFGGAGVISFDVLLDRKRRKEKDEIRPTATAEVVTEVPKTSTEEVKP